MSKIKYLLIDTLLFLLILTFNPVVLGIFFGVGGKIETFSIEILLWLFTIILLTVLLFFIITPKNTVRHIKLNWKSYLFSILLTLVLLVSAELSLQTYYKLNLKKEIPINNYEFNHTIYLNSDYFRDDEFIKEKEASTCRIFLIGDSFVFGTGVRQNETIDKLLEKKLNRHPILNYEVYNLGMFGTSPAAYYKNAKRFREYKPDLVVLSIYVDNDVIKKRKKGILESLVSFLSSSKIMQLIDNLNRDCIYPWVEKYDISEFYRDRACAGEINPWLLPRATAGDNQRYYDSLIEFFDSVPNTKNDILAVRELHKDVPFILLINPSKYQVSNRYFEELKKIGFVFDSNQTVNRSLQDKLISWAVSNGVDYVDVLPYIKERENTSFYYVIDDHYNLDGNKLVAEKIYDKVEEKLLLCTK